jgi:hypothetical protein
MCGKEEKLLGSRTKFAGTLRQVPEAPKNHREQQKIDRRAGKKTGKTIKSPESPHKNPATLQIRRGPDQLRRENTRTGEHPPAGAARPWTPPKTEQNRREKIS